MKRSQNGILIGAVILSMTACGIGAPKKPATRTNIPRVGEGLPVETAPADAGQSTTINDEDLLKLPRTFSEDESVQIPRQVLDRLLDQSPQTLTFKPDISFSALVSSRAFVCSMPDPSIELLLKAGITNGDDIEKTDSLGAMLVKLFPPTSGHFRNLYIANGSSEYLASTTFATEDAAVIRSFYCLKEEPAVFVERSVAAFEEIAAPETLGTFHQLSGQENAGISCFVQPISSDRASVHVEWTPTDTFTKEKLPTMNLAWAINGASASSEVVQVTLDQPISSEFARNSKETSTYTVTLTDPSGRVSLSCSRAAPANDDSVVVTPQASTLCGSHNESRDHEVEYFVDVDAGFQFPATQKTYETTCGGSVEAYHIACAAGEVAVENSHSNTSEECVYMNQVCVGGGALPRICQNVPEMRHRNKGSILCQNPARATRSERRVRVEPMDVSVPNTCEIPSKI